MKELDLKLRLFCGESIVADGFGEIIPLTLRQVVNYGYGDYIKRLNIVNLTVEDFLKDGIEDEELKNIDILTLLIVFGGEEIESELEKALELFLGGEALIDKDNLCVFIKYDNGVRVVNSDNYESIREVLKWQNYINHFDENTSSKFSPADEKARKFKERMDKLKKQRDEIKKKKGSDEDEGDDIDFYDIVSSISSKSYGVNEANVGDLTIYQLYSKFKRLEIIDQYDISIKSILAGAKDVKLRHWSSKEK